MSCKGLLNKKVSSISMSDINTHYLVWRKNNFKLKGATLKGDLTVLQGFLNWCFEQGKRKQRKYLGGKCQYGKDIGENNVLVDCEKQQKEIRLILMMRKQGKKYMEIVKEMERYTGRRWFLSFVHKVVQREKVMG